VNSEGELVEFKTPGNTAACGIPNVIAGDLWLFQTFDDFIYLCDLCSVEVSLFSMTIWYFVPIFSFS
jgi:hypothetical protein